MTNLTEKEVRALNYIRDKIVTDGKSPSVRNIADFLGYKSPRSSAMLVASLISKGWVKREGRNLKITKKMIEKKDNARTVQVPLVGSVTCGSPVMAEENIETYIPISESIVSKNETYFLLKASGDSMNKSGINDQDLLLVKQQNIAENGQRIVALINDETTVKEFHKENGFIVLKPNSTNSTHQPIIVSGEFSIQGVVAEVLPNIN